MRVSTKAFVAVGVALAVGLAVFVSPYASSTPDGLEKVAGDKNFLDSGETRSIQEDSPIPDYAFPGVDNEKVATGLAGFVGTLLVFALAYLIAWAFARASRPEVAGDGGGGGPGQRAAGG